MAKSTKGTNTKKANVAMSIEEAYKEALARFSHRENITGIDIGYKYKDGKTTGEKSIRLHVKEKLPESALEAAEIFPEEIRGFSVDVLQANYKAGLKSESVPELVDRTQRFQTIQPGISIGHPTVTAGTLGLIVRDNKSGKPAILSNWHILAGSNTATPGDEIMQPGRYDGGRIPRDTIARLERMILDQDGDAAIALVTNDRPISLDIMELNVVPNAVADPSAGDVVVKSGRTTEVTQGKVEGVGRYFIDYSVGRVGIDGFRITTTEHGNPGNVEISKGGDSGSAWMLEGTGTMVGLHFAGETDPRPEEEHALACFSTRVFSRLNISLLDGTVRSESGDEATIPTIISAEMGKATVSRILHRLDAREIRTLSRLLERNYPRLVNGHEIMGKLEESAPPELGGLGVVTLGFAAGAISELIREEGENITAESYSLLVSSFLAGALAGARAVEGRLPL